MIETEQVLGAGYLSRREVIEIYIKYDARKKNRALPPDFSNWPWSDANALDMRLQANGFKPGIIAGYKTWREVTLARADLLNCAIVDHLFQDFEAPAGGFPQLLGELVGYPEFQQWKPKTPTKWAEWLEKGNPYPTDWPMILRPAKQNESPAKWYIEDGSGRAVCFLRWLCNHPQACDVATGFLGIEPDRGSNFMRQHFYELLSKEAMIP